MLTVVQHIIAVRGVSSKSLAFRGKSPVFTSNAQTVTLPNRIPKETFQDAFCSPAQWSGGLLALLAGWNKVAQMLRYHQISGQETQSCRISVCGVFSGTSEPLEANMGDCFWVRTLQLQVRKGSPQTPPWPFMEMEECSLEIDCHRASPLT